MSWSDRRRLLGLVPALLVAGACGFEPVYGPEGRGGQLQGRVAVEEPADRNAFLLVQELEQRLGRAAVPDYDLAVTLRTASEGQAVTAAGDITRFSIVGEADYRLTPRGAEVPVAEGTVRNFTGYSATGSTVETLAAERDAQRRLMIILADQITARLYATADLPE